MADEATLVRPGVGEGIRLRSRTLLDRVAQRRNPNQDTCEADRIAGWTLQDSGAGPDRLFAAMVVLCTHDRASAEVDTYGPGAMTESIMTSVCALGDGRGLHFVDCIRRSAPGQRRRRATTS